MLVCQSTMDSIVPAKKRKAAPGPPPLPSNDDPRPANLSLADLNNRIDQLVADAVNAKILALTSRVDGLQRENEGLLLRCESLERSVQVLNKEGNWTYSAPAVPRSHWIDQGHNVDYANDAESLIQSIKEETEGLRRLTDSGGVEGVSNFGNCFIRSDTALGPHWEQLADAVQLSIGIKNLNLWNVQLDKRTLQKLESSVRQKGITRFDLTCNQFLEGDGAQFAIGVLKSNRLIETFYWRWNPFHRTDEACDLIDAVLEHPTISDLNLIRSLLNEGIDPYAPVKRLFGGVETDTLLSVDLSHNDIRTNGDRSISDFLSANPPLKTLNLTGNQLTDDDAIHIAQALQLNLNLTHLELDGNALTVEGKDTMYHQAIFGISPSQRSNLNIVFQANLNSVSGANHTCKIDGISFGPKKFMNYDNESAKWNRGKKIFTVLVDRHLTGCMISQLESDISGNYMGLVPHIFACINTYSANSDGKCLSLLFELARNWKTPEIYQLHQAQLKHSEVQTDRQFSTAVIVV